MKNKTNDARRDRDRAEQAERDRLAVETEAREEADALAAEENARAERMTVAEAQRDERDLHERQIDPPIRQDRRWLTAENTERNDLKLYTLSPRDVNAPPFHFTGTVRTYVVAARSEKEARQIAAGAHVGEMSGAWEDDKLSECVELAPTEPGVVARDMGA